MTLCPKCGSENDVALGQTACFRCGADLPTEGVAAVDANLAGSLSEKSDEALIEIVTNPAEWKPEVVDYAHSELGRRSISTEQIEKRLAERAREIAKEFQSRSNVPLSFWESFFTVLYGAGLGLFGLLFVWPQASGYKSNGYILKSQKSWHLYWSAFIVRLGVVFILIVIVISTQK